MKIIGLISDTHGLLRPEALGGLTGSDYILHAGDVGDDSVLERLVLIAPVTAVRGNVDKEGRAACLPGTARLDVDGVRICLIHNLAGFDHVHHAPADVVVYGHSHKPAAYEQDGIVFINPGSAGPRRFRLPVTVGRITIADGRVTPQIIEIEP